jgi:hypothetical protein
MGAVCKEIHAVIDNPALWASIEFKGDLTQELTAMRAEWFLAWLYGRAVGVHKLTLNLLSEETVNENVVDGDEELIYDENAHRCCYLASLPGQSFRAYVKPDTVPRRLFVHLGMRFLKRASASIWLQCWLCCCMQNLAVHLRGSRGLP